MAFIGSVILFLLAAGSTWLTYQLFQGSLPASDKVWLTAITAILWGGFWWCIRKTR
jgi:hypothetical protein